MGGQGEGDGPGFGKGPGRGPRGKANENDPSFKTKPSAQMNPGKIISALQYKTQPTKGELLKSAYSEAFQSATQEAAEALQQEEIPPGYRMHVRDYFDSIRPDKDK